VLAMLLDQHDFSVVMATLPVAAGAGIAYAIVSAGRAAADLEKLAAAAERLDRGPGPELDQLQGTAEVVRVAAALRAASERLAQARERERAMEASRRDLVAWASHDLRTPLTSLRAVAEALQDEVVTDEAGRRRYLASLTAHVDRLSRLVDDLFELSQIEASALQLKFEPTHLPDLIGEVLDRFGPGAEADGVTLEADVPGQLTLTPVGRDQIGRVLANLVANGIRHTPAGGRVLIQAWDEPGRAVVRVLDQCGGIPTGDLPRVFDSMWRGDPARGGGGAGLGLAIARGLVEAHGGQIAATNVPGGCMFSFFLPRAVQREPSRLTSRRA
jgi:signal transduction histidine kinase